MDYSCLSFPFPLALGTFLADNLLIISKESRDRRKSHVLSMTNNYPKSQLATWLDFVERRGTPIEFVVQIVCKTLKEVDK